MALSPEAKRARAAYMREWRRRNPEKEKIYQERKWERKAARIQEERAKENNNVLQDV